MKKKIIGLSTLLYVACYPSKPIETPAAIPEIKLGEIILEPEPQRKDEGKKEQLSKSEEPFYLSEQCDRVKLEEGSYPIKIRKSFAVYDVNISRGGLINYEICMLLMPPKDNLSRFDITIYDDNCDNTIDRLTHSNITAHRMLDFSLERSELEDFDKKRLDLLLEETQKFVCPKNQKRVKDYLLNKIFE